MFEPTMLGFDILQPVALHIDTTNFEARDKHLVGISCIYANVATIAPIAYADNCMNNKGWLNVKVQEPVEKAKRVYIEYSNILGARIESVYQVGLVYLPLDIYLKQRSEIARKKANKSKLYMQFDNLFGNLSLTADGTIDVYSNTVLPILSEPKGLKPTTTTYKVVPAKDVESSYDYMITSTDAFKGEGGVLLRYFPLQGSLVVKGEKKETTINIAHYATFRSKLYNCKHSDSKVITLSDRFNISNPFLYGSKVVTKTGAMLPTVISAGQFKHNIPARLRFTINPNISKYSNIEERYKQYRYSKGIIRGMIKESAEILKNYNIKKKKRTYGIAIKDLLGTQTKIGE